LRGGVAVGDIEDFFDTQIGRGQDHQRIGQVIGDRDMASVFGERDVAAVESGADFRRDFQCPQIEFRHPAVARGEKDVAAVGGEFRPAVQSKAAGETIDRRESVAIDDGDMMVAALDHDEEIERIGGKDRSGDGKIGRQHARSLDLRPAPHRRRRRRRSDVSRQRLDRWIVEIGLEARHFRAGAAVADDGLRARLPEPTEIVGQ
jgi:hypothetical protein